MVTADRLEVGDVLVTTDEGAITVASVNVDDEVVWLLVESYAPWVTPRPFYVMPTTRFVKVR